MASQEFLKRTLKTFITVLLIASAWGLIVYTLPATKRALHAPNVLHARKVSKGSLQDNDLGKTAIAMETTASEPYHKQLVQISKVWGQHGLGHAWPHTVHNGMPTCQHPGMVQICPNPRTRLIILYWSAVVGDNNFTLFPPSDGLLHFGCCDGIDMIYTMDRKMLAVADIVEFAGPELPDPLPSKGHKYQLFMATSTEAQYATARIHNVARMSGINLLRSYAWISDIRHSFTQPGECYCKQYVKPLKIPHGQRHVVPVSALVSNCWTFGGRHELLKYMMKKIAVHSMGGCLHNHKLPANARASLENYLYNFAVENAICMDYITEKFQRALSLGTVPIVLTQDQMPGYEFVAPTNSSYVDLSRFRTLDDAIMFIRDAAASKEKYAQHHSYRGKSITSPVLSAKFKRHVCKQSEDNLDQWCRLARTMQTRRGREQLLQKTYDQYNSTSDRQCAERGSMLKLVPR
ncbi:alpha-(1,3)-fucosyltransferase 10-like [Sycon ciliatum]|uniref:alpha-(1,3)-fucosyltransferase 10-like n=1 Tax=Sycon ciliatum TaxID=27933 RepID=UPI0031F629EF